MLQSDHDLALVWEKRFVVEELLVKLVKDWQCRLFEDVAAMTKYQSEQAE